MEAKKIKESCAGSLGESRRAADRAPKAKTSSHGVTEHTMPTIV